MAKKTNQERVEAYFSSNKVGRIFQTSDGTLFLTDNIAASHGKTLKDKKVTEHAAPDQKGVSPEPKQVEKEKTFNDQSVKEMETALQKETDTEKIEGYLAEENRSSQPRSTAIEALEDRIKELNKEPKS